MVDAPVETLLKQIVKGIKKEPTPAGVKIEPGPSGITIEPSTSGIKKEKKSPKTPIPSKPSTSKSEGLKKKVLTEGAKAFLKKAGVDPKFVDEGGYSPKGKGKKYKKAKKTEVEKLQEGWEPWEKNENKSRLWRSRGDGRGHGRGLEEKDVS